MDVKNKVHRAFPGKAALIFRKKYLIEDIYSRKAVGWEVYEHESGERAAELMQRTVLGERCAGQPLVLHSDNGAPGVLQGSCRVNRVLSCYFQCRLLPLWVERDGADRLPISRCT